MSDPTRMAIFQKLSSGPIAVNEIASALPVSRPAVSQHLKVLKDAGLVTDSKAGTRRLYQLNPEGVARLRAHFDPMWTKALSSFPAERKNNHQEKNMTKSAEELDVRKKRSCERADRARVCVSSSRWSVVARNASNRQNSLSNHHCRTARVAWYERNAEASSATGARSWLGPTPSGHVFMARRARTHHRNGKPTRIIAKASEVEIRFTAEGPGVHAGRVGTQQVGAPWRGL